MPSAKKILEKLKKINNQSLLQNEVAKIVTNDEKVVDEKRQEFLLGRAPNGEEIGIYAWKSYERLKRQMNPLAGGNVDLKLTGAFHRGLFVRKKGNRKFDFHSTDSKADMLFNRGYLMGVNGSVLRGLNEETFLLLQKTRYRDILVEKLKSKSGLS